MSNVKACDKLSTMSSRTVTCVKRSHAWPKGTAAILRFRPGLLRLVPARNDTAVASFVQPPITPHFPLDIGRWTLDQKSVYSLPLGEILPISFFYGSICPPPIIVEIW